jgi:hypothetical protein
MSDYRETKAVNTMVNTFLAYSKVVKRVVYASETQKMVSGNWFLVVIMMKGGIAPKKMGQMGERKIAVRPDMQLYIWLHLELMGASILSKVWGIGTQLAA